MLPKLQGITPMAREFQRPRNDKYFSDHKTYYPLFLRFMIIPLNVRCKTVQILPWISLIIPIQFHQVSTELYKKGGTLTDATTAADVKPSAFTEK